MSESNDLAIINKIHALLDAEKKTLDMKDLIELLYKSTYFIGGMHEGILYKELPNNWSSRESRNDPFTDDEMKYACDGDEHNDCTVKNRINNCVGGNIDLVWEFGAIHAKHAKYYKSLNIPSVWEFIATFPKIRKDLFFDGVIIIYSEAHADEDHRGTNHCLIQLPFKVFILLEKPTLEQFVDALYTARYKKFDKWYELFVDCDIEETKNKMLITLNFDYGS